MSNSYAFQVILSVESGDYISTSSIAYDEGELLHIAITNKIKSFWESVEAELKSKNALSLKNGEGEDSYDGSGFDYVDRRIDAFWYFPGSKSGKKQLKKLLSTLIEVEITHENQVFSSYFTVIGES